MISAIFFTSFLWLNFFSNDRWVHLLPRVSHFFSPCPFILISFYNFPAFSGGGRGELSTLDPSQFFFFFHFILSSPNQEKPQQQNYLWSLFEFLFHHLLSSVYYHTYLSCSLAPPFFKHWYSLLCEQQIAKQGLYILP